MAGGADPSLRREIASHVMNRETKRQMARQQRTTTEQGERLAEFRREQAVRQRETIQAAPRRRGFGGIAAFIREVIAELKKVVRPSRRTVAGYTVVVLVFVSAVTIIIFGLDWLFGKAVLQLFT
jgi:preprotein translocase subunit SecE